MLNRTIALCCLMGLVTEIPAKPSNPRVRPQRDATVSITQEGPQLRIERKTHKTGDLVEQFAKFLGWTVLNAANSIHPKWQATIRTGQLSLSKKEGIDVLSQLLFAKDFVIVPLSVRDKTYELISTRGSRRNEIMSRAVAIHEAEVITQRNRYMPVVTTLDLRHITTDAAEVRAIVFPLLMSANSTLLTISTKGRVVTLHGLAPVVATSIEILRAVDKPEHPATGLEARLRGIENRLAALERRAK